MPTDIQTYEGLGHFAIGFAVAFAVLFVLLHLRLLLFAALAGIVVALVVIIGERGFDGLAALAWDGFLDLRDRLGLYEGLLAGKLAAAVLRFAMRGRR